VICFVFVTAGPGNMAGVFLNGERGAASNLRLTYREFFGGGDGKPPESFSLINGAASPFVPTIFLHRPW